MNVKVPILVQEIHKLGVLTHKGVSGEEKNNRFQLNFYVKFLFYKKVLRRSDIFQSEIAI